jgi:uncharacterized protein
MQYLLSKYTRTIPYKNADILIIYNTFNGNQSYIYDQSIKNQLEALKRGAVDEAELDDALKNKYCVIAGTDETKEAFDEIRKRINDDNALNIIIIPTTECNFRCEYCYEEKEKGFIQDEILQNLYEAVKLHFSEISGSKSLRLDWFGGEPLLYYEKMIAFCARMNQYCIENSVIFQHSITTNGYLLTKDKASRMIENGIHLFQITIDGAAKTHDKYRHLPNGSPTWQKIIDNLIEMKSLTAVFKVQIRVNYNFEVAESLDEFYEFFKSTFGDDYRFELTFHAIGKWGGENDDRINVVSPEYQSYMMCELTKMGMERGVTHFAPYLPRCGAELCYANMKRSYVIYKNGTIGKCTLQESPNPDSDFVIGDIYQGCFHINREKEQKWIYSENEYKEHIKKNQCGDCISFPICGGISCPAYRVKNGVYTKKCTPTMFCIDELINMNYEMMR